MNDRKPHHMKTRIIDGRALARRIRTEAMHAIKERSLHPGLGVILVGDDPASHLYVNLKERACAEAGIRFEKRLLARGSTEAEVLASIEALNVRDDIDGILVQLPLPEGLDETKIIEAVRPDKDVDGFHPETRLVPGLATGILLLAKEAASPLQGKSLHVMANSTVFREPVERLFLDEQAVLVDDPKKADIVVVAVGKPGALTGAMIKEGAAVIDVGTNRIGSTVVGDGIGLDGIAGAVTPVPGGVGPVTVAMLIRNTVELASRRAE